MIKNLPKTNQTGFTLVELLITTSLTVMLMLTITTMFMTFLVGNSKTNIRKKVKEEGLVALSQMEFIIKNAYYVEGTCGTGTTIDITSLDGGTTTYSQQTVDGINKIASTSAALPPVTKYLTSDSVNISNLNFVCTGETGNRQVIVSFSLTKNAPTLGEESIITEDFKSIINMRN